MSKTRVSLAILGAILILACVSGCASLTFLAANAPTAFSHVDRHVNLAYGAEPRQQLDVYEPQMAAKQPVVIFWYGGSWQKGNKSNYRFVGNALAKLGFVAVLPDYRLYPQVKFPLFDEDGAQAVAWVEQHAQEFGGDPKRIVLMGHSAGGHTAAFLAFNHAFWNDSGRVPKISWVSSASPDRMSWCQTPMHCELLLRRHSATRTGNRFDSSIHRRRRRYCCMDFPTGKFYHENRLSCAMRWYARMCAWKCICFRIEGTTTRWRRSRCWRAGERRSLRRSPHLFAA